MSLSRRGFLVSATAGGAACLVGCPSESSSETKDTTGTPCELPPVTTPPPLDYPSADYFKQIASDLDAAGIGTPIVFADMDRADGNIDAIISAIAAPLSYRIVEKSLPSLDLLSYVSKRAATDRFLVLHLPFLSALLGALPDAEVLVGKAHLTSAVRSFFNAQPAGTDLAALSARLAFIADSQERLTELEALAKSLGISLRIVLEIDVGLRRSGLSDPSEMGPVLQAIAASSAVQFGGLLGYEGHVAFTPGGTLDAVNQAFEESMTLYQSFMDVLTNDFPALAALPDLVFNSGGSTTFPLHKKGGPVNDVAAGGGVLRPGGYPDYVISMLKPAIFVAAPILKQYAKPQLPFFSEEQSADLLKGLQGVTVHGGRWNAYFTYPENLQPAPFVDDPTDHSMVPNQGMLTAPAETPLKAGDWVFFHPRQSDVLFQFEEVHEVRAGHLTDETMAAYPRRF